MTLDTAHLTDLSQNYNYELENLSVYESTREAVLDGSVVLDPRNFNHSTTLRTLVRLGMVKRFGDRQQGVQYYILTDKGWDALFPA